MTITITAFERSPDGGKDWRVIRAFAGRLKKWAKPYEVRFVSFRAMKELAHRALHPFGQIPTLGEEHFREAFMGDCVGPRWHLRAT